MPWTGDVPAGWQRDWHKSISTAPPHPPALGGPRHARHATSTAGALAGDSSVLETDKPHSDNAIARRAPSPRPPASPLPDPSFIVTTAFPTRRDATRPRVPHHMRHAVLYQRCCTLRRVPLGNLLLGTVHVPTLVCNLITVQCGYFAKNSRRNYYHVPGSRAAAHSFILYQRHCTFGATVLRCTPAEYLSSILP